jgi:predicted DNA-binding transcriptional regulator
MSKMATGIGLLMLSGFMAIGFMRADLKASRSAIAVSWLLAVGLPAVGGVSLMYAQAQGDRNGLAQKQRLRQQTLESEILRLATAAGGKLTLLEVVRDLAVEPAIAQQGLDALLSKGIADLEITESGVLVYVVYDLQRLPEKLTSQKIHDV